MRGDKQEGSKWWGVPAFLILVIPLSWYSWLLGYADDPGNSGINPLGPLAAALLVSVAGGWKSLTAYLRNISRVRCSWGNYATALLLPVVLAFASVAVLVGLGSHFSMGEAAGRWKEIPDAFLFTLIFVALGEEPGWRGWLLPRMQLRMTPWQASLAIAPIWALWHLPMFGEDLPLDQILPFLISLTSASVVLTWLTNRTEGGVLPAMLCHATVNSIGAAFLFTFFDGLENTRLWWINAILWGMTALVFLVWTKGRLGMTATRARSSPSMELGSSSVAAGVTAAGTP